MFPKGVVVKCVKPARGLTVGNNYLVTRAFMGQSEEYDREEVTNDAGVMRQIYSASIFELTNEPVTKK